MKKMSNQQKNKMNLTLNANKKYARKMKRYEDLRKSVVVMMSNINIDDEVLLDSLRNSVLENLKIIDDMNGSKASIF